MNDAAAGAPETILRQCAASIPHPWYPSDYVRSTGITRAELDPHLDQLRMAGLIHLTEWVAGKGQGYALTAEGGQVLESPRELERLRNGVKGARLLSNDGDLDFSHWQGTAWEQEETAREALFHLPPPVLTRWIVVANTLVFLAGFALALFNNVPVKEFIDGANSEKVHAILHATGALDSMDVLERGQFWRLMSCAFVHIGFLHLAVNMIVFYSLGRFMERMCGHVRFLILYLLSCLAGSCAMVLNNARTFGAGASGGVWGVMVALTVWIFLHRRAIGSQSRWLLGQLLFAVCVNSYISTLPGISAAAHFGGGAMGLVAGLFLNLERFGHGLRRQLARASLLALPLMCLAAVELPHALFVEESFKEYDRQFQEAQERVRQIDRQELAPLLANRLKMFNLAVARQASSAFAKIHREWTAAVGTLEQTKSWNPLVENHLHELLQACEEEIRKYEIKELNFYLPHVRMADGLVTQNLRALQQMHRRGRPPGGSNHWPDDAAALDEEKIQLDELAQLLDQLGPYSSTRAEEVRFVSAKLLQSDAELLQSEAQFLRKSLVWPKEAETALNEQYKKARSLRQQLDDLLQAK